MKTDYENFARSDGGRRLLRQEDLIMQVLEDLSGILEAENISRVSLAQRLGKTKGFVSQILSGGRNLTLRTIADICWAIGYAPRLEVKKECRRLVSLTSIHKTVHAVDWMDENSETEVHVTKPEQPVEGKPITANQELELVA
jgi:transcriptional regulator with XRE-family HTH domain